MSLTDHLKDGGHPATRYLDQVFHRRAGFFATVRSACDEREPTLGGGTAGPAMLGWAFEYCVGLDLAGLAGYPAIRAAVPDQALPLLNGVGSTGAQAEPSEDNAVDDLIRASWYLASWQDVLHKIGRVDPDRCRTLLGQRETDELFHGASYTDGRQLLVELFEHYMAAARPVVRSWGAAQAAPVLRPRFATADFAIGGTLLEIKTGWGALDDLDLTLNQMLAYALLGGEDRYQLAAVAIYLARHGVLHRRSLDSLLTELSGYPTTLAEQRAKFPTAVANLTGWDAPVP